MPGSPMTVRSSGERSATTRANVSRSSPTSSSRPISGWSSRRPIAGASGSTLSSRKPPSASAEARAPCRTTCQVDSESRISPPAPVRASRSATATASPMTGAASGGPLAATTSPVQTPERARRPNGSCSTRAPSSAAARRARRASSSCATGMPSTARTASLRRSTTRPSQLSQTASAAAWKRLTIARSDSGSAPAGASAPVSWQKTHVTQRRVSVGTGARSRGGDGSGTSWRRIADSSARSSGDGSIPSPSTSARWASRYASSASACRPLR